MTPGVAEVAAQACLGNTPAGFNTVTGNRAGVMT
jgi:hypothetical protein